MKTKKNPVTPVIFRRWPKKEGGGVIAIFPRDIGTINPYTCNSYEHVGQHGSCDPVLVINATKPARLTEKDVQELKRELERYGPPDAHYNLQVKHRHTQADLRARQNDLEAMDNDRNRNL